MDASITSTRPAFAGVALCAAVLTGCSRPPAKQPPVDRVLIQLRDAQSPTVGVVTVETTSDGLIWSIAELEASSHRTVRSTAGTLTGPSVAAPIRSLNGTHCWFQPRSVETSQRFSADVIAHAGDKVWKTKVSAASMEAIAQTLKCDPAAWQALARTLALPKTYWFRELGGPYEERLVPLPVDSEPTQTPPAAESRSTP